MIKKRMHKRSQFYLLTAILLSVVVFLLADLPQRTEAGSKEPLYLYQNFISEAPRVINNAIYNSRNMTSDFDDFTSKFIYHAGTKNINLSLFYAVIYGDQMVMSNRMGEGVNVTTSSGEIVLNHNQSVSMARKDSLNVEIGGISYPFAADQNVTSFKLIFRTEDLNSNKEVYIYG